jgi:hypothetical protein
MVRFSAAFKLLQHLSTHPITKGYTRPGFCSGFAVSAANLLYGVNYNRGDAWELAAKNSSSPFDPSKLKEGCILGINLPNSAQLKPGRKYAHVALYLGNDIIVHNFITGPKTTQSEGTGLRLDKLSDFLREKSSSIIDIIEPPGGLGEVRLPVEFSGLHKKQTPFSWLLP